MKLNSKYILREIAGETILVSLSDISAPKRLLCLNDLGKDIYVLLQKGLAKDEVLVSLLAEYDVEEDRLRKDLEEFLHTLQQYHVILED